MLSLLPRKRRWCVLFALAAVLAVAWVAAPRLLVPTIQRKLQAMIATQLKADVKIGSLRYAPPYGVRVRDLSVVADDPRHGKVEVLKVALLDLRLAKLPLHKGPLVIENITINRPELRLVIADGAVVGRGQVVRPEGERFKTLDQMLPPGTRLSDMFELRHFGLHEGLVVVDNRDKPGAAPMVWRALDVEMQTAPRSKSSYDFGLATDPKRPAQLSSSGSFDLDELWVQLDKFHLAVTHADDDERSALPAQVQALLKQYDVNGRVTLDLAGRVPLRDPRRANFSGSIDLTEASVAIPQRKARIDSLNVRLVFAKDAPAANAPGTTPRPINLKLEAFSCTSGQARLTASFGSAVIDDVNQTWAVSDLRALVDSHATATARAAGDPLAFGYIGDTGRATIRLSCGGKLGVKPAEGGVDVDAMTLDVKAEGLTVQPKKFDAPFEDLRFTCRKAPGTRVVLVTDGSCAYGRDQIRLVSARLRVPLDPRALKDHVRIDEITGVMEFRPPRPTAYPLGFGRTVEKLQPSGIFQVGGGSWYSITRYDLDPATTLPSTPLSRRKADYFFSVTADAARFDLLEGRVPMTGVKGGANFSPLSVRTDNVRADVYGGSIVAAFHSMPAKPSSFDGEASVKDIQLKQIGDAFQLPPKQRERLSGKAYLNLAWAGELPRKGSDEWLDTLRAQGEFEVFGGQFWTLPVLGNVAERAGQNSQLTVGEAAGRFDVKDRQINLTNAAVQSPALGLVGSGRIGFDQSLDLKVIAAPLGDWRERLKRGGIPILSDAAGEVFGAIQKVLNTATSTLLYEFRVKGTLKEPKVDTVPVPGLTEPAALLLGQMMRDTEGKDRAKWSATAKQRESGR